MKIKAVKSRAELESALKGAGTRLVLFYSGYCPFCISFLPAFKKAAEASPDAFVLACVDGSDGLDDQFAVEVVPTVLCFSGGKLLRRLDGKLGLGLNSGDLRAFVETCLPKGEGK
jgi:thioredoxin-like negative regulator of GroEL